MYDNNESVLSTLVSAISKKNAHVAEIMYK